VKTSTRVPEGQEAAEAAALYHVVLTNPPFGGKEGKDAPTPVARAATGTGPQHGATGNERPEVSRLPRPDVSQGIAHSPGSRTAGASGVSAPRAVPHRARLAVITVPAPEAPHGMRRPAGRAVLE
jgi:DNA-binding IclR family transcriptional regulator